MIQIRQKRDSNGSENVVVNEVVQFQKIGQMQDINLRNNFSFSDFLRYIRLCFEIREFYEKENEI